MNELNFDIKTSRDFFLKLKEDYKDFCNNTTSSRIALNCALTAWHLTEWVYNEYNSILQTTYPKLFDFQSWIKSQCTSLQVMHDIANGTKHYLLTRHTTVIEKTNLHQGAFSSDFSRDFDISALDITLKDGAQINFEDEIEKSIEFWKQYLNSQFNLSV
jgi:hypothetical protein